MWDQLTSGDNKLYSFNNLLEIDGGERGIRTPGTVSSTAVFKTAALNHSAISPILIAGGPCTPAGALHCARAPFRALIDRRGPLHPGWRASLRSRSIPRAH